MFKTSYKLSTYNLSLAEQLNFNKGNASDHNKQKNGNSISSAVVLSPKVFFILRLLQPLYRPKINVITVQSTNGIHPLRSIVFSKRDRWRHCISVSSMMGICLLLNNHSISKRHWRHQARWRWWNNTDIRTAGKADVNVLRLVTDNLRQGHQSMVAMTHVGTVT